MLKTIWTETKPEFKGTFQSFETNDDLAEAGAETAPADIGRWRDAPCRAPGHRLWGWMIPLGGRGADLLNDLPRFRQMAAEAGRDADSLPVSVFSAEMDEDVLKRYRDAGIERVVFSMESEKADQVLPVLDKIARLIQSVG